MVSRREAYEFQADEHTPTPEPIVSSDSPDVKKTSRVKDRDDVKVFTYKHAIPVHTTAVPSILAKDAPPQSYRGFLTLAMLVLLATNIRLVIENLLKYGVLVTLPSRTISDKDWVLFSLVFIFLQFSILLSLLIEKMLSRSNGSVIWVLLHWANICSLIVVPTYTVYFVIFHPLVGGVAMSLSLILFLKLASFLLVNSDLRRAYFANNGDKVPANSVDYPNNLTVSNYYYFIVAPTLCYQISYPRSEKIRIGFVMKRLSECFLSNLFTYFLVVQYAIPTLRNASSLQGDAPPSPIFVVERVLKLSTISVTVWLLGFYSLFHSFLNATAELLRFGDRNFYQPWWNSSSLSQYWRLWNQPVHQWMKRHLYVPGVSAGYPGWFMLGVTFFFSAVFHELLFGVAVHSIQGYAFWGMLAQIPLIMLTSLLVKWRGRNSSAGNVVFWLSFCILGQPFLVVLYYYDWTRRNPAVISN
ncbi:hypothetical protein DSO57_1019542 [Entomophthora muscae]|uniref:Uncharacterized protein n=2 Tax=Entomophthora muscae TaxID=34485 RepID=A0ACC2S600_9FUNG|nr:hypothetical protein DSO57_1019542 [Entomophthora muscae]